MLPGRDGAAFLKRLREQPHDKRGAVPAIAVTAYGKRYPATEVTGWAAYFLSLRQLSSRRCSPALRR